MSMTKLAKRVGAAVSIVALAVAGLVATAIPASASPSTAAGPGELTICSEGRYIAFVVFPARDDMFVGWVAPDTCFTAEGLGESDQVEEIVVMGADYSTTVEIDRAQFRPSKGATVHTYGTLDDPWATVTPV